MNAGGVSATCDQVAEETRTSRIVWLGFGILLGLVVLLLAIAVGELSKMERRVNAVIQGGVERTAMTQEMYKAARERSLLLVAIVNDTDPFERDEHLLRHAMLGTGFIVARERLVALGLSVEERELMSRHTEALAKTARLQQAVIDAAQQEQSETARNLLVREAIPVQEKMLNILAEISDRATLAARAESQEAGLSLERTLLSVWAGGGITLLCGVGVAWWVRRRLFGLTRERGALSRVLHETLRDLMFQKQAIDAHAIVSITDTAGDITYVNDKFLEVSGYGRDDLIGKNHRLLKSNVQPQTLFEEMWGAISAGQLWHGEMCNRAKDGRLYWLNTSIVPFLGENGLPTQYISVRTDITPMKESEAALWKGKQELEQRVSERTAELRDQLNFTKKLMTERERGETELNRRYEEVQALNRKLQDMQHQLLQSEKMASVGQLAAGVAHEINNPIGYVYSNLGTLEKYIQDMFSIVAAYEEIEPAITDSALLDQVHAAKDKADLNFLRDDMRAVLSETREGITRVKKIVQDLKDFSRIDTRDEWHWADLQKGLDSTLNIVHNELKYKADVRKEYADIPEVECRPSQLNQVFLNLLVNAGHAIESKGVITIRTGQTDGQVWVEIADSGKGIEPQHLPRIFDPFFTTKPVGQGTGLGLSLSYGIVQKHGGRIEVQSEPGRGTTFRVWLPITQRVPSEAESHA